jgi:tetratricopeptide (TPR) repeat protein
MLLHKFFLVSILATYNVACSSVQSLSNADSKPVLTATRNDYSSDSTSTSQTKDFETHFNEALRLGSAGEQERAIEEMNKALEIRPDHKISLYWISRWYSTLRRFKDEADVYRRIIKIDPNETQARLLLSQLLVHELHEYEEGLKEAQISKQQLAGPDAYVIDKLIAEAYAGLGDNENAIKYYKLFLKESVVVHNPIEQRDIKMRIQELAKKQNQ